MQSYIIKLHPNDVYLKQNNELPEYGQDVTNNICFLIFVCASVSSTCKERNVYMFKELLVDFHL